MLDALDNQVVTSLAPASSRARSTDRTGPMSWLVLSSAHTSYYCLITLFVFSAYFTTEVVHDPVRGQALWSYVEAAAALLLAIAAPIFGSFADAGGRLKPWLAGFIILAIPCLGSLWFAIPRMSHAALSWILVALVGGRLCFDCISILVNAFLARVATKERIGLMSGLGQMCGAFSNLVVTLIFLEFLKERPILGFNLAPFTPQRTAGPFVALWTVLLSLPFFYFATDMPRSRLTPSQTFKTAMRNLVGLVDKVREYRNAGLFLLARTLFNQGFTVLMVCTGLFAAGILHWTPTMLLWLGLMSFAAGALAALLAGLLDGIGSKTMITIFIAIGLLCNLTLCTISRNSVLFFFHLSPIPHGILFPGAADKVFAFVYVIVAICVSGDVASSRAFMAKVSPHHMLTEFFSLYAVSGTATSFIGPLAIGITTSIFGNQRAGASVGAICFALGLVLLLLTKEEYPVASQERNHSA